MQSTFPLLIGACFGAQTALAQTLEEVIVTATKTEENLQTVASAVSAFTSEQLEEAGVRDLYDLSSLSPGLAIQSSGGGESTVIRLRGMGSQRFDQSVAQFVGVFIDEITQHRPGVAMAALMDVERVEVLRGPQSVLYGKNVPAGAISIVSKRPEIDNLGGDATVSFGNHSYRNAELNLNIPLLPGILAARISGLNTHRTGETDVQPAGQTWGGYNRTGGRLNVLFEPSDSFSANITYLDYESTAADFQQIAEVSYVVNNPYKFLGFIPPDAGEIVPGVVPASDLSPLNDPTAMPSLGLGTIKNTGHLRILTLQV
jgi:iron complex outermembrane receptor protein